MQNLENDGFYSFPLKCPNECAGWEAAVTLWPFNLLMYVCKCGMCTEPRTCGAPAGRRAEPEVSSSSLT